MIDLYWGAVYIILDYVDFFQVEPRQSAKLV